MHIIEFYTRMRKDGSIQERVKYAPSLAEMNKLQLDAAVSSLRWSDDMDDGAKTHQGVEQNGQRFVNQAHAHWVLYFEPAYEAWKKGSEIPEDGTPISAWPALDNEQIKQLRAAGIPTIEALATANESILRTVRVPNVRGLQTEARKFLELRETAAAVHALSDTEAKMKALQDQVENLTAALAAQKPKRGRPPKEKAEEPETNEEAA